MKGFLAALRPWAATIVTVALAATLPALVQATSEDENLIKGTSMHGKTRLLANDRYPALYTGKFGDCLGGHSLIEVTGFDAAYYADNMTVMFHLTGSTKIQNDSIMGMAQTLASRLSKANHCLAYISVDACMVAPGVNNEPT